MPPELFDHDETVHTLDENEEIGFTPVWVDRAHSIFDGLNERALFYQLHGGEVKRLPSGFSKIAESHRCKIQAIVHHRAPIFGTQFHPEAYNESYPDGKRILENFFRMANAFRHGQPAVRHKPERC
jgi:GMP synthase (glutamine-hydrolysing)